MSLRSSGELNTTRISFSSGTTLFSCSSKVFPLSLCQLVFVLNQAPPLVSQPAPLSLHSLSFFLDSLAPPSELLEMCELSLEKMGAIFADTNVYMLHMMYQAMGVCLYMQDWDGAMSYGEKIIQPYRCVDLQGGSSNRSLYDKSVSCPAALLSDNPSLEPDN